MSSTIQKGIWNMYTNFKKFYGLKPRKNFALLIGMDRTYYASVESGKRNISIVNIEKIALGLGVPISSIFKKIRTIQGGIKR